MQARIFSLAAFCGLFFVRAAFAGPQPMAVGDDQGNQERACIARCAEEAKVRIAECLQSGGDQRDCLAAGQTFQHQCDAQCRGGKTCEDRCEKLAARAKRHCLAEGGTEDHCDQLARDLFQKCITENCQPTPPTCEEACENRAIEALHQCLDNGGSQDDCAMHARMLLHQCIEENCPPPPGCEDRCKQDAHGVFRICVEMGGAEDKCAQQAREYFEHCVEAQCPQPTCEDHCADRALAAYKECVANGGEQDLCAQHARELYNHCTAENCSHNVPCDERCRRFAAGVKRMCLEMGGSEADCEARAQDALGQCLADCPAPCGGIQGLTCSDGQFCQFPPGTCDVDDQMGRCRPIPEECPDVYQPVCGCDGKTYGNACEAAMALVSIAYEGECRQHCGGVAGLPCDEGEFCLFPPGTCNVVDNMGMCVIIPETCPDVWQPVCGCDGKTYSNRCEAFVAEVSLAHEGPCEPPHCGGPDSPPCADGSFCSFPPGSCGGSNTINAAGGLCRPIPTVCPMIYRPVCGCDGVTYGNECEAAMHSQSIKHEGPCQQPCGGIAGLPCDEGEFCLFAPGTCQLVDNMGLCVNIPETCPDVRQPVCGCDNHTYANVCLAAHAGVSLSHPGPCDH